MKKKKLHDWNFSHPSGFVVCDNCEAILSTPASNSTSTEDNFNKECDQKDD